MWTYHLWLVPLMLTEHSKGRGVCVGVTHSLPYILAGDVLGLWVALLIIFMTVHNYIWVHHDSTANMQWVASYTGTVSTSGALEVNTSTSVGAKCHILNLYVFVVRNCVCTASAVV